MGVGAETGTDALREKPRAEMGTETMENGQKVPLYQYKFGPVESRLLN